MSTSYTTRTTTVKSTQSVTVTTTVTPSALAAITSSPTIHPTSSSLTSLTLSPSTRSLSSLLTSVLPSQPSYHDPASTQRPSELIDQGTVSKHNAGVVAGGVTGGLAGLAIVALLVLLLIRRRKRGDGNESYVSYEKQLPPRPQQDQGAVEAGGISPWPARLHTGSIPQLPPVRLVSGEPTVDGGLVSLNHWDRPYSQDEYDPRSHPSLVPTRLRVTNPDGSRPTTPRITSTSSSLADGWIPRQTHLLSISVLGAACMKLKRLLSSESVPRAPGPSSSQRAYHGQEDRIPPPLSNQHLTMPSSVILAGETMPDSSFHGSMGDGSVRRGVPSSASSANAIAPHPPTDTSETPSPDPHRPDSISFFRPRDPTAPPLPPKKTWLEQVTKQPLPALLQIGQVPPLTNNEAQHQLPPRPRNPTPSRALSPLRPLPHPPTRSNFQPPVPAATALHTPRPSLSAFSTNTSVTTIESLQETPSYLVRTTTDPTHRISSSARISGYFTPSHSAENTNEAGYGHFLTPGSWQRSESNTTSTRGSSKRSSMAGDERIPKSERRDSGSSVGSYLNGTVRSGRSGPFDLATSSLRGSSPGGSRIGSFWGSSGGGGGGREGTPNWVSHIEPYEGT